MAPKKNKKESKETKDIEDDDDEVPEVSEVDQREKDLAALFKSANKTFGAKTLYSADKHAFKDKKVVPTGILPLDYALGGGLPAGRISMWYGHKSCLSGRSVIPYQVRMQDGRIANHKGGDLKHLWERFNKIKSNLSGSYQRKATMDAEFWTLSVNEENCLVQNRIKDVIKTGIKPVFRLTTSSGRSVVATADHRFYTGENYTTLGDLVVGDTVFVHSKTYYKPDQYKSDLYKSSGKTRKYVSVKNHPIAGSYSVTPIKRTTKNIKTYFYKKLNISRATMEAHINNLGYDEYINRLNSNELDGLKFLSRDEHVHHLDEDFTNNSLENIRIISSVEHGVLHSTERKDTLLRFVATEEIVASIASYGNEETFDIEMEVPFQNFVADGFVTHNSSKTTNLLRTVGNAQKLCSDCYTEITVNEAGKGLCVCGKARKMMIVWLDVEGAWEDAWASNFVNLDDTLIISQPKTAEETSDLAFAALKQQVDIIVIDSIAFMIANAELEKSASEQTMGLQARAMGNAMRRFVSAMNSEGREKGRRPTVWMTNQMRQKIGVMFGSNETISGGLAAGFATSVEVKTSAGKYDMDDVSGKPICVENSARIEKNKMGPPRMEATWKVQLMKTELKDVGDIIDEPWAFTMGEKAGLISVAPQKIEYDGKTYRGRSQLEKYWMENREEYKKFQRELMPILLAV